MHLGQKKNPPETLHLAGYHVIILAAGMLCRWHLKVLNVYCVDKRNGARVFPSMHPV